MSRSPLACGAQQKPRRQRRQLGLSISECQAARKFRLLGSQHPRVQAPRRPCRRVHLTAYFPFSSRSPQNLKRARPQRSSRGARRCLEMPSRYLKRIARSRPLHPQAVRVETPCMRKRVSMLPQKQHSLSLQETSLTLRCHLQNLSLIRHHAQEPFSMTAFTTLGIYLHHLQVDSGRYSSQPLITASIPRLRTAHPNLAQKMGNPVP